MLFLVRHGRPRPEPDVAPEHWRLDPAGFDDIDALRRSGRLPTVASWFSSPEPKATATAQRLTDAPVTVVDDLAEHRRGAHWFDSGDDFGAAVRRAFDEPERSAVPGWEPLAHTRARVVAAVRRITAGHAGDCVLVGHGTAWTVLVAALTGRPPDLVAWERLAMPDLCVLEDPPTD
jgi:broad specificity phosphatase PhoE